MIYLITVLNNLTFDNTNRKRSVGYFFKLEDAVSSVINNELDIYENEYEYVLIEALAEGLYCTHDGPYVSRWFKFDHANEKYTPIDVPKEYECIINVGVG